MQLEQTAHIVLYFIMLVGACCIAVGTIKMVQLKGAKTVEGRIVDNVQEYTTRGFIWKDKIEYLWNGSACYYTTRARSFRRGSETVKLSIKEDGTVIESGHNIEMIAIGLISFLCAAIASSLF